MLAEFNYIKKNFKGYFKGNGEIVTDHILFKDNDGFFYIVKQEDFKILKENE
jgi:hypothetical protein